MAGPRAGRTTSGHGRARALDPALTTRWFAGLYESPLLYALLLDDTGRVLGANCWAVEECGLRRTEVLGRPWWEGGWWAGAPRTADEVHGWVAEVLTDGRPLRRSCRYTRRDGSAGELDLGLHRVRGDDGVTRVVVTGVETTSAGTVRREREDLLERLRTAGRLAERRLQRLAGVALELLGAHSVEDLADVVIDRGLAVLGADGGAVGVLDGPAGVVRLTASDSLAALVPPDRRVQLLDSRTPGVAAVRTGQEVLLPDRASGLAWSPEMAELYRRTGRLAWAALPLRVGAELLGSLTVCWRTERRLREEELGLLRAFAAECAQCLHRLRTEERRHESARAAERLSEALQRCLLTSPPVAASLDVAVRYQPAAEDAQVGGDWYDAFVTAGGTTVLTVGDVAGHDRTAAATMGQVRSLVRGLAFDTGHGPARVLTRLDSALTALRLDTLATAVLATLHPPSVTGGPHRLCWSTAGHPPPMLRHPDGRIEVLAGRGVLLGLGPGAERTEQEAELPDGSTLLLYTDGLVERRDRDLDESLHELAGVFARVGGEPPERVCDRLLEELTADGNEDDVALLVLRCCTPS